VEKRFERCSRPHTDEAEERRREEPKGGRNRQDRRHKKARR
jgi:hypothetical protein